MKKLGLLFVFAALAFGQNHVTQTECAALLNGSGGSGDAGRANNIDIINCMTSAPGWSDNVNAQTGTTYTVVEEDAGRLVTLSNGSAIAVTLPQAGTTGFEDGSWFILTAIGAGTATVTPTTSTINGAATLELVTGAYAYIYSDGTNYRALASSAGSTDATIARTGQANTYGAYKQDLGAATLEIPNGTTLPATCAVGEQFMDTDATTGQRHYLCESTDTWALQGDGGGGGGIDNVVEDTTPQLGGTLDQNGNPITYGATPASAGVYRLANASKICWRDVGDTADACFYLDTDDVFKLDAALMILGVGGPIGITEAAVTEHGTAGRANFGVNTSHLFQWFGNGDALKTAALGDTSGNALTGDSATSFFSTGTIEAARLPTGINAANIGGGGVSTTEFDYLGTITSNVQDQLNGKQTTLSNVAGLASALSDEDYTPGSASSMGAATKTLTNTTLNVESTGNAVTTVEKIWLEAAGCQNTTAGLMWDTPTSNPAVAACVTGTNTQKGVADFADGASTLGMQRSIMLPNDWTGAIDLGFKWLTSATTGSVVWQAATICVADGETDDPAFNTASTVTDAAKGTTLQTNDAAITGLTTTGCAGGELMHLRVYRDPAHASDNLAATARLIGVMVTMRRAQ